LIDAIGRSLVAGRGLCDRRQLRGSEAGKRNGRKKHHTARLQGHQTNESGVCHRCLPRRELIMGTLQSATPDERMPPMYGH
jgi:hypothetical protein